MYAIERFLVTLLYIQRITCGNLWIRILTTIFLRCQTVLNFCFCKFKLARSRMIVDEFCGSAYFCGNDLLWISLLAYFGFQNSNLRAVHGALFVWMDLWPFAGQNFLIKEFFVFRVFNQFWDCRSSKGRHRQGNRSRTPAKIQWSQNRGAHTN